jgi:signal transduction histidine kinase
LKKNELKFKKELEGAIARNDFMLKARDNLLKSVNHELRAPLTRMKMDLEFMDAGETRESLAKDIQYMQVLVEELMDIEKVKLDSSEKKEVNLNDLLTEVIEKLKIDLDLLDFDCSSELSILGHAYQLEKLFKNLIENAYKYKTDEGKVIIKTSKDQKRQVITILNEGNSIPTEDLPFIFEPFFRVDKSRSSGKEGLGLGLNICKEIIDVHGGKIQVSSKKDFGTIFKLTFPI